VNSLDDRRDRAVEVLHRWAAVGDSRDGTLDLHTLEQAHRRALTAAESHSEDARREVVEAAHDLGLGQALRRSDTDSSTHRPASARSRKGMA